MLRVVYLTIVGLSSYACAGPVNNVRTTATADIQHPSGQQLRPSQHVNSKEAYFTLLYGDVYMLGVRVLGQSLRNTKTNRDYVVLCTEDVSEDTKDVLRSDGWIVKSVQSLANPYTGFSPRFEKVLTKLLVWSMTEYRKIVFIDSDAMVVRNVDHLFRCGNFCASFRHSDLFNTGIIVLDPSQEVFEDMKSKLREYESYDGGDQGFLNSYFPELKYSLMFNAKGKEPSTGYMRLPAGYNADIGVYYMLLRWSMPPEELMIVHYTLGPMKPWKWWSYPFFELNWEWLRIRRTLLPHYDEPTLCELMNWLPLILLSCLYFSSRIWLPYYERVEHHLVSHFSVYVDPVNGRLTRYFNIPVLCLSAYIAFQIVPLTISPVDGWIVYGMWVFCFLVMFYFPFCHITYVAGQRQGQQKPEHYIAARTETLIWMLVAILLYITGLRVLWTITAFSLRLKFLVVYLVFVFLFSHFAGGRVIRVWFGSINVKSPQ